MNGLDLAFQRIARSVSTASLGSSAPAISPTPATSHAHCGCIKCSQLKMRYSSVEFNALFELAHKVRKELVGAPFRFEEISDKFVTMIIDQRMLTT